MGFQVFLGFSQSVGVNSETVIRNAPRYFPSVFFAFYFLLILVLFNAVYSETLTEPLHTQEKQHIYNITMRRVRETIVAVEKLKVLHISVCVCVSG